MVLTVLTVLIVGSCSLLRLSNASHIFVLMLKDIVNIDPEVLSGTPVFKGTRVPIKALFDYLEGGKTLDAFFEDFPAVKHSQVSGLLNAAHQLLISSDGKAAA